MSNQGLPESPALLNEETLTGIIAISPERGGQILQQVVGLFEQQLSAKLAELETLLGGQQQARLQQTAHAIKSTALNIGAQQLAALMNELEQEARAGCAIWDEARLCQTSEVAKATFVPIKRRTAQLANA